ncbi:EamA family transporter [Vulcanisaeta distributa]|uniref:EamA family transporter n=1 Tax=Vulcanisaeta distributa TaxID=164451 RepID=UPI000A4E7541|nr:EamA family transporter [Vulcanisaeta distributa]
MAIKYYAVLTVAVVAISWASILILLSGAQPIAVAFWRTAIAAAVLSPLLIIERKKDAYTPSKNELILMVISGVAWQRTS